MFDHDPHDIPCMEHFQKPACGKAGLKKKFIEIVPEFGCAAARSFNVVTVHTACQAWCGLWYRVDEAKRSPESRVSSSDARKKQRNEGIGSIAEFLRGLLNPLARPYREARIIAQRERHCREVHADGIRDHLLRDDGLADLVQRHD